MTDKNYKVYLTPLVDEETYGTEIEISDYVISDNLSSIKKNTDSEDYNIGDYRLGSISLVCTNYCGEFNDNDPRSFFQYKSQRAKVRVVYYDSLTDSSLSFKGLTSDDATVFNSDDTAKIKVLANDSIIDTVQVQAGVLENGDLFSEALKSILNNSAITAVLTYDASEIEVDLDLAIDDVTPFSGISTWQAVRQLLIASNSVLYVDDETIKVKTRDENTQNVSYFYGPGDTLDRENIVSITDYNNGAQRIFNSIIINDSDPYSDTESVEWFGLKQKKFTFDFITDSTKELLIAKRLVNQFRYPRLEFKLTCKTQLANQIGFFDTIGVSHPIKSRPYRTTNAPLWDLAKYDTTEDVYPIDFGGVNIDGRLAFQIIQRIENPSEFQTTLKLRGRGKTFDDGVLIAWISAYDFSRWDVSTWG